MSDKTGGPAFPLPEAAPDVPKGMTLLDYFAAKAMQSMVASHAYFEGDWEESGVALCAYEMAEAMLAEREKRNDTA